MGGGAPVDRVLHGLKQRLARARPMRLLAVAGALLVAAVLTSAVLSFYDFSPVAASGQTTAPEDTDLHALDGGLVSSDLSGVPDALQNFLYGTDPTRWNTSGTPLPDGWLIRYGYDPLDPTIDHRAAATPPVDALPAAYGNQWPARFTPTLWEVYAHDRPADWDEASMGPFQNGIVPTRWDNGGDGIPDGWLLHHGLDPRDGNVSTQRLAGPDGLTVREAFEHNADPNRLDSDGDGIRDREELDGPLDPTTGDRFPPTDPARASTAGSGVCDGYLVAHGLDPTDSGNGYRDLAGSGATTLQKFRWSHDRFGADACSTGRGLDPTRVSTLDGPIPDGWLLRYKLDPLDTTVPGRATQSSQDAVGPWSARTLPPEGEQALPEVSLTVLDEYRHGRPRDWDEARVGPWWGGTDPSKTDTDGDGLPDAVEVRGFFVAVATDVGPNAAVGHHQVSSDPTRADTSGDGLTDFEAVVEHGTDPTKRDTDLDGIPDATEVALDLGLDPTRADTALDHLLDGARLDLLQTRSAQYRSGDLTYTQFPGEPGVARQVTDWACSLDGVRSLLGELDDGVCPVSAPELANLFGPGGDLDDDGIANVLDPDIDGDGLLNGWEAQPSLYRFSPFGAGSIPRPATDPLNPDTDGDGLDDAWEVQHGRPVFSVSPPRRSLDPAQWDSDGDGVPDAQEDPDDDGTDWSAYPAAGGVRTERADHPNILEQQFGTDPHAFDTDEDGLADGWKVFWGVTYPTLLAGDPAALGVHRPPGDQVPADAPRPTPGVDQSGVVVASGTYTRFSFQATDVGPDETQVDAVEFNGQQTIHRIEGPVEFSFNEVQAAGTNPYLASTTGDGVPDWWKWHHSEPPAGAPEEAECVGSGSLDPLDPDAWKDDLDEDGLDLRQEYEAGTNPWCRSTTLTGFPDSLMASGFEDPLDPRNALALLDQEQDTDGDGLKDFEELLGSFYPHLERNVPTGARDPDTDGDGLLDGDNVVLDPGDPQDAVWIGLYRDLGIAHRTLQSGNLEFFGEKARGTHPLNPDDAGQGVPAGWLVVHDSLPPQAGRDYRTHYTFAMPDWWDLALHGPWWGGLPPSADPQTYGDDADRDGLKDADGDDGWEDPMPGANRQNAWTELSWTEYPTSLGLADPGDASPSDEELDPVARRLLAQSYLDPRADGNKYPRSSLQAPANRDQSCIDDVQVQDASGKLLTRFTKGETAYIVGRVHDCSGNGDGRHGVTVDARVGSSIQKSFGAAFTSEDGSFRIPVTITTEHQVAIPDDAPAVVLRGQTAGLVTWTSDPSIVEPGPTFVTLRTYASPENAPYTDHRPPLSSVSRTFGYAVQADSEISLSIPPDVVTGTGLRVDFHLVDSGGAPLKDPVEFHWAGNPSEVVRGTPDASGRGHVLMPAPHGLAGQQTLEAHSRPSADRLQYLSPASAAEQVLLRNPVDVRIDPVASPVNAGTGVPVRGEVVFQNRGLEGVTVRIDLTQGGTSVAADEVVTGPGGSFRTTLPVPDDQPRGEHVVVVTAQQTSHSIERQTSAVLDVRSLPRFTEVTADNITQGAAAPVSGRLVEPDGSAVADATVHVDLGGERRTTTTDDAGRFSLTLSPRLPVMPILQVLESDGDPLHAPATHRSERAVLAPTTVELSGGILARGADLDLPVRLLDAEGLPVEGAPVRVTWGKEPTLQVLTNATGHALFHREGSPGDPIGPVAVRAEYPGSRDGGRMAAVAAVGWEVRTLAEFVLPEGTLEAGTPVPSAVLRDAGTHQPLPRTPVEHGRVLEENGTRVAVVGDAVTDASGRFVALSAINRTHAPERVHLLALFDGNASYGPVVAHANLTIQSPVEMDVGLPARMVTGRDALVHVGVQGLDGRAVDNGTLRVTLLDETVGSAPVQNGSARLNVSIPDDAPVGAVTLRFLFEDAQWYAPAGVDRQTHLLRGVTLLLEVDAAEPGRTSVVRVTAVGGGQPMPFAPIHLQVEGLEGGLRGTTDEDGVATFRLEQPAQASRLAVRFAGEDTLNPAHATGVLAPATPPPALERGATVLFWVFLATALAATALVPVVYRLRMNPLQPLFWRARKVVSGRGPHEEQILRAYHELEEAAIGQGLLTEEAPTARLLQEALAPHIPAAAHGGLDRLIGLFEVARYGTETLGPAHQRRALEALDVILHAMRAEAGITWPRPREDGRAAA